MKGRVQVKGCDWGFECNFGEKSADKFYSVMMGLEASFNNGYHDGYSQGNGCSCMDKETSNIGKASIFDVMKSAFLNDKGVNPYKLQEQCDWLYDYGYDLGVRAKAKADAERE